MPLRLTNPDERAAAPFALALSPRAVWLLRASTGRRIAAAASATISRTAPTVGSRPTGRLEDRRRAAKGKVYSLFEQSKYQPPHRSPVQHRAAEGRGRSAISCSTAKVQSTVQDYPHRDIVPVLRLPGPGPLLLRPPRQEDRRPRQPDLHRQRRPAARRFDQDHARHPLGRRLAPREDRPHASATARSRSTSTT